MNHRLFISTSSVAEGKETFHFLSPRIKQEAHREEKEKENYGCWWKPQHRIRFLTPCSEQVTVLQPGLCSIDAVQLFPQSQQMFFFQMKLKNSAVTGKKWSRYFQLSPPLLDLTETVNSDPALCECRVEGCFTSKIIQRGRSCDALWTKPPLGQWGGIFNTGPCQQREKAPHPIHELGTSQEPLRRREARASFMFSSELPSSYSAATRK